MAQEELHAIEKRKTRIVYFNSIAHQLDFRICLTYAVEVIYSCIAAKYNRSKANRNETRLGMYHARARTYRDKKQQNRKKCVTFVAN